MGAHMSSLAAVPAGDREMLAPQRFATASTAGYILYWVIFGVMAAAAIVFAFLTFKHPEKDRKHGYLTTAIVTVAATAYFAMASHGGDSYIPLYWDLSGARDVFYARYIDWFVTTPLLLLDVLLLASVPVGTALWVVFADILMILFGLFGAITDHVYRWGYFAIGCFWMLVVFWGLFVTGPRYAFARDRQLGRYYLFFAAMLGVLWCIYPIIWGLAEGSNTISVTAEIACYGGLDITAKVIFGFLFLLAHERVISHKLDEERARGKYAMSLLSAPVTSPLHSVELGLAKHPGFAGHNTHDDGHSSTVVTRYVAEPAGVGVVHNAHDVPVHRV